MTEPAINHWGDQPSGNGLLTHLDAVEDELVGLLDLNVDVLDVADRKTALVQLDRLVAMQHALSLRLLAGGDRIGTDAGNRDAGIIPIVLGGESEVLDLGRTRRTFTAPQRKAIRIRDQHCCAEGCTVDATWCDAHHWNEWVAHHGATDLENAGLLCPFHHRRAHDPRYRVEFLANGTVRFHRHD